MNLENVHFVYSVIANLIAIISVLWALLQISRNRRFMEQEKAQREAEQLRLNQTIKMILIEEGSDKKIIFPAAIRRSQFTRAEVQGRLSVSDKRYNLPYLNTRECLEAIDQLYVGSGEEQCLTIPCDAKEFSQVDKKVLEKSGFDLIGF